MSLDNKDLLVHATIKITMARDQVRTLLRQDPMGPLKDLVYITINDAEFQAQVVDYVSSNGVANLTLLITEEN